MYEYRNYEDSMYHGAYHRRQPRNSRHARAPRWSRGCAELHDRMMVGVRAATAPLP
jgi:hypothetical protein